MEYVINSIEEINKVAATFVKEQLQENRVIAFYGKMGVGKTTFIKAICEELEVVDIINSPTFAIVNEYDTAQSETLYHFDFYRIKEIGEALDFGCEDYLYSGNTCLIEWPELIEPILPEECLKVKIELMDNNSRKITV